MRETIITRAQHLQVHRDVTKKPELQARLTLQCDLTSSQSANQLPPVPEVSLSLHHFLHSLSVEYESVVQVGRIRAHLQQEKQTRCAYPKLPPSKHRASLTGKGGSYLTPTSDVANLAVQVFTFPCAPQFSNQITCSDQEQFQMPSAICGEEVWQGWKPRKPEWLPFSGCVSRDTPSDLSVTSQLTHL